MAGIVCSPARLAARQRRSPAISWNDPISTWRTRTGCRTPSSRKEAVRALRLSSSNVDRGWAGLGSMAETGICRYADSLSPGAGGISAPRPLPSPLRRPTAYLLGQLAVGEGAPRGRVEHDDGLPERRGLGETYGPRHDAATDRVAEVFPHLPGHLLGQAGAGVIHGEDAGAPLDPGAAVALHQRDVLEELAQT